MRKILLTALLLLNVTGAFSQLPQEEYAKVSSMLDNYLEAIEDFDLAQKAAECDFLISSCSDSLVRQAVAIKLYGHFVEPKTMGEEALAVYLYDKWFATGEVKMQTETDRINAGVFADFNRPTLLGMQAPSVIMRNPDGEAVTMPSKTELSVLYFYDTSCAKCSLETLLLRNYLEMTDTRMVVYAVYAGTDADAWAAYRQENFNVINPKVSVVHLWDPEVDSDFLRLYGVIQTPRMFLVDTDGTVIGRRLTVDALRQLVEAGAVRRELEGRCELGTEIPDIRVGGTLCTIHKRKFRNARLKALKGNPAYVIFFTNGCERCEVQLSAVDSLLDKERRARVFLVDVDEILAENREKAKELFDNFDLTKMPFILKMNRKGIILDKYIDLYAYASQEKESSED